MEKGTPLAPELLSAFEVLHSKEELEEKKIERKKNKPDAAALRDAKRGHKARIGYARIVLVCLLGALLAVPAFAEGGASGPLDTINNLSDLVFQCVRAVGVIVAGYGIVQIGLAVQSMIPASGPTASWHFSAGCSSCLQRKFWTLLRCS